MEVSLLNRRQLGAAILLVCIAAPPGLAVRRRGAKLYPNKETTADMSGVNKVFLGWVDMKEDDYAAHGYPTREIWADHIKEINREFLRLCTMKLAGKTVVGAQDKDDENAEGYDLYLKFSEVMIDYSKYHLYLSIHFIDPNAITETGTLEPKAPNEIGTIPARPYFGNDWGLVNYLKNAMDEISQKIKVEIAGADPQKRRKIPLIRK